VVGAGRSAGENDGKDRSQIAKARKRRIRIKITITRRRKRERRTKEGPSGGGNAVAVEIGHDVLHESKSEGRVLSGVNHQHDQIMATMVGGNPEFILYRTRATRGTEEFSRRMMGRAFPLGFRIEDVKAGVQRIPVVWGETPVQFTLKPVQRPANNSEKSRSLLRVMASAEAQSPSSRPSQAKKGGSRAGGMQVARRAGTARPTTARQLVNVPTDG